MSLSQGYAWNGEDRVFYTIKKIVFRLISLSEEVLSYRRVSAFDRQLALSRHWNLDNLVFSKFFFKLLTLEKGKLHIPTWIFSTVDLHVNFPVLSTIFFHNNQEILAFDVYFHLNLLKTYLTFNYDFIIFWAKKTRGVSHSNKNNDPVILKLTHGRC